MIDHRSFTHNLSSCEIKAWKTIQAWMVFKPIFFIIDTNILKKGNKINYKSSAKKEGCYNW